MRLLSAFTLFSAGALATNHGWNEGRGHQVDYQMRNPHANSQPAHTTTQSVHGQPVAVVQPAHTSTTTSSAMVHVVTTTVSHPQSSAPARHEMDVLPRPAGPMTHTVIVGGTAGLVYNPPHISAAVGDIVHFVFQRQNHSVTQSTFDKPCNRMEGGEDSGLLANVNDTVVPAPTWQYTVKEETPTWWYCKQRTGNHCGRGMVFAINPTAERSFDKFREVAMQINGTVTTGPPAPQRTVTDAGSPVTLINGPVSTDVNRAPVDAPYTAPGWNERGDPNACNCACFCGVGSFPQGDGWGHYGGVGGSLNAPW